MAAEEFAFRAERVDSKAWKGQQSIEYQALWLLGQSDMVRVRIDRDSYDFQSSAEAHVWRDRWEPLASIPYPQMATLAHSPYTRTTVLGEVDEAWFQADEHELIRLAGQVLYAREEGT